MSCFVFLVSQHLVAFLRPAVALLCASVCLSGVFADQVHAADARDLRVHIAWGGGDARQWSGRVYLTKGQLQDLALLGSEPEQAGAIQIAGQQVVIRQRKPQRYDGLEVTCVSANGELRVELLSHGEVQAHVVSVPIAELADESITQAIDDEGNRIVIRRLPSDRIRVRMPHEHLVFAPGNRFRLEFDATDLGVTEGTALRCHMQIRSHDRRGNFWTDERRQRADSDGSWPNSESLELNLADRRGRLRVGTRHFNTPAVSTVSAGDDRLADRSVRRCGRSAGRSRFCIARTDSGDGPESSELVAAANPAASVDATARISFLTVR